MPFRQVDIDVQHIPTEVALSPEEDGVAVLVRRKARPVAYWLERRPPGSRLTGEELRAHIAREAGRSLLRYTLDEQLASPDGAGPDFALTVAVCTHNRPERLRRCLEALRPIHEASPERLDVLVVDNAPPDGATRDVVSGFPFVRYAVEPVAGLNVARNRALEDAHGDWIAYLDDDVVADASWRDGLRRAWREHPDARAVTGLVLPWALDTEAQILFELAGGFRRGCKTVRFGRELRGNALYPCGSGIFGAGANMAFHVATVREIGAFDPALDTGAPLPGGGDLDMFFRIIRHGYVLVYEPSALVFHEHRRSLSQLRHQYYTWGLGFMAYVMKHLRTDEELRPRFLRLTLWWMRYQFRNAVGAVRGTNPLPVTMALAEWAGGIVGMAGEYERSQRRMAARCQEATGASAARLMEEQT